MTLQTAMMVCSTEPERSWEVAPSVAGKSQRSPATSKSTALRPCREAHFSCAVLACQQRSTSCAVCARPQSVLGRECQIDDSWTVLFGSMVVSLGDPN